MCVCVPAYSYVGTCMYLHVCTVCTVLFVRTYGWTDDNVPMIVCRYVCKHCNDASARRNGVWRCSTSNCSTASTTTSDTTISTSTGSGNANVLIHSCVYDVKISMFVTPFIRHHMCAVWTWSVTYSEIVSHVC